MDIRIIKSKRKSISIQINPDMTVTVRTPQYATNRQIEEVLMEKEGWIKKNLRKMANRKAWYEELGCQPISLEEKRELIRKALDVIPPKVEHYSTLVEVEYGRITIRNQKKRWGSCSSKRNLNFNCLLMLAPEEVLDYVIVHELCHIKQMNHSKEFWHEVEKVIPNYRVYENWLNKEGGLLMQRSAQG